LRVAARPVSVTGSSEAEAEHENSRQLSLAAVRTADTTDNRSRKKYRPVVLETQGDSDQRRNTKRHVIPFC
jgi:hypothetical protein